MATFHPHLSPDGAPASELRVRQVLALLDDSWHVFQQVRWQSVRNGRQGDGEADFLLLHKAHGFVVLEVKGGRLAIVDGRWLTTDRHDLVHEIKNPFVQATASKHALLAYLGGFIQKPPSICHAVVFPDAIASEFMGMQPREIVLDGADLATINRSVVRVLAHWEQLDSSPLSASTLDRIVRSLAPTVVMTRRLKMAVAEAEEEIVRLSDRQVTLLGNFRRIRRCVVTGGAGTGKTLLVVAKARQVAAAGGRALVVCFNALLAEALSAELGVDRVTVRTFHALCFEHCRAAKRPIPRTADEDWWALTAAAELRAAATELQQLRFDALLVDETQDFKAEWLTALESLLSSSTDSLVYLFSDPHQCLFHREYAIPVDWPVLELDANCRNTRAIAAAAATAIGDPPVDNGATGRPVSFIEAKDNVVAVVQSVVDRLVHEESVGVAQVVVLCDSRSTVSQLRTKTAGGYPFVELGRDGIQTETIQRFKGLEAPVVVLVVSNPPASLDDDARALLYVGASRGRSFLVVVAPPRVKAWLGLVC